MENLPTNLRVKAFDPSTITKPVRWSDVDGFVDYFDSEHFLFTRAHGQTGNRFSVLSSWCRHSIAWATHPQMLQYLPMADLEAMTYEMNQGGGIIIFNTPQVLRDIFRWVLVCSLHEECITPKGSKRFCDFKFPKDDFGGCHRYDQAMMSIIVANANNYNQERYRLNENEYPCEIQRM